MAVLSKEDFMSALQSRVGEDNSDEALSFIENMTDTYNDMETRVTGEGADEWKAKYEELDKSWREKYRARFFNEGTTPDQALKDQEQNIEDDGSDRTFEDLFEEREG